MPSLLGTLYSLFEVDVFKRSRRVLVSLLLCAAVFAGVAVQYRRNAETVRESWTSVQAQATHVVGFYDDHLDFRVRCTATAIGPHAIMTAAHCNPMIAPFKFVRFDASQHFYVIRANKHDDQDHVIYLLSDGPEFRHWIHVRAGVPVKVGETLTFWGCFDYPCSKRVGTVRQSSDPSDLDGNMFELTSLGFPGDSGAAIFNKDGNIVGLLSFQDDRDQTAAGFTLAFSQADLDIAAEYVPIELILQAIIGH
jgi:hypothetical protein